MCEIFYMQTPPLPDLSNVSMKSDAAYISTLNGIFYVNKIKKICIEITSIQNTSSRSSINKYNDQII